jgi:signal transduction histidine kinase
VEYRRSIFLFVLTICMLAGQVVAQPIAREGVLDLRGYDIRDEGPLEVHGEWRFHWSTLISPTGITDTSGYLVQVPKAWKQLKGVVPGVSAKGFASYQLRILVPPGLETVAFRFTEVFSGSGYYINGRNIGFNGLPGTNKYQAVFGFAPTIHVVPVRDTVLDLVVHVSNFEHRSGGIRGSVEVGTPMQIMSESAGRQYRDYFLLGAFLVISIYFMGLYLMGARLYILFFSLIGLVMSFRILILSDTSLDAGAWISGISRLRLEYLSFDLLVPLFVMMVRVLFPNDFPTRLFRIIIWVCALMIVLVVISPVSLFSAVFIYYMIFVMVTAGVLMYVMIVAWLRGRSYAPAFVTGIGIAATGALIDMLNIADVTESGLVSHVTMFAFLLIYAFVFSEKNNEEAKRDRLISEEQLRSREAMESKKEALEQQLSHVTEALDLCREDLGKSRKALETNIALRNKFFTVLGHDIKAPVGYVKQVVDMMLSGEAGKEDQQELLKLISNSSHATLGLLENLIYWGRSQSGELKSMAVHFPLARVLGEITELFDLPLKDKQIALETAVPGELRVYADKEQAKLILRNLLSNAIKFTHSGGKIVVRGIADLVGNQVWIEIEDNGVGIPPGEYKELLSSPEINSTEGTRKEKGTGIGLKLCRELTALNQGVLEIESEVGKGTLFRVKLPMHPPHLP